jgi:hypothetical protein
MSKSGFVADARWELSVGLVRGNLHMHHAVLALLTRIAGSCGTWLLARAGGDHCLEQSKMSDCTQP